LLTTIVGHGVKIHAQPPPHGARVATVVVVVVVLITDKKKWIYKIKTDGNALTYFVDS
jgi:hypothetical protein